jgi:iron complex transport system ATP-binding protein
MNTAPLFEIQNGCFKYGSITVLQDLTFQLAPGKFYGLIGPNGSGKSTLIDLLMGTRQLYSGQLTFQGKKLSHYKRRHLARHLALVPQHIFMGFDFSVYDIVLMGRHPHIPRFCHPTHKDIEIVDRALKQLDIQDLKYRPVSHLSGGEKQRVIVARALAQDTAVLLLDEATSNLDIKHTLGILRVLRDKVQGGEKTVIAAIHDLNFAAAFCDELLVLNNSSLYTVGSVRDVLTTDLLEEVFSVTGKVVQAAHHPTVQYQMLPDRNYLWGGDVM